MNELMDSFVSGRPILKPPHVYDMMVANDIIHVPRSSIP